MTHVTKHFAVRVRERISNDADPDELAENISRAIKTGRTDYVEFVSRVSRTGKRLFRFRVKDGRYFYALVSEDGTPITLMPPGFTASRQGRPKLVLS